MIRAPSGSDKSVNKDKEVNIFAVSSVLSLPLFLARTENTAKVRIGAATGVK
jgi:hypothetical protein